MVKSTLGDDTILTFRCQFYQHFTIVFFANNLVPKNCKAKFDWRKAAQFAFVHKTRTYMLMKLSIGQISRMESVWKEYKYIELLIIFFLT